MDDTFLVVGLGNPGETYLFTRHNVGKASVEIFAQTFNVTLKSDRMSKSSIGRFKIDGKSIIAALPLTFMNDSGLAVKKLVKQSGIESLGNLIVVHDEMDLAPGRIKIKRGGGTAGHNGLESICDHLGSNDFVRIRIGIGKPPSADQGANYVLRRLKGSDKTLLIESQLEAVKVIESIIRSGFESTLDQVR